jgi:hypothetical protein
MHVSLAFHLASAFADIKLCFPPLSPARYAAGRSFDEVATGAARSGDRNGHRASLFLSHEVAPL